MIDAARAMMKGRFPDAGGGPYFWKAVCNALHADMAAVQEGKEQPGIWVDIVRAAVI